MRIESTYEYSMGVKHVVWISGRMTAPHHLAHSHFASRFWIRAPQLSSYENLIDVTSIVEPA